MPSMWCWPLLHVSVDTRIGFGFSQSCGNRGSLYICLCCGAVAGKWIGSLDQNLGGWCCVCELRVWILCVGARYRCLILYQADTCTQCSILLHRIDICSLPCICSWHVSICLCVVVGPGFIPTSSVFMRSMADLQK